MAGDAEGVIASSVAGSCAIAAMLKATLSGVRNGAAEILTLAMHLPDPQRRDLQEAAKLLCDNLSAEIALYSFLSDWVRKLEPHAMASDDPQVRQSFVELKIAVMGD